LGCKPMITDGESPGWQRCAGPDPAAAPPTAVILGAIMGSCAPAVRLRRMVHLLAFTMLALYAGSFVCYALNLRAPSRWIGRTASFLLAAGIAAQYFALYVRSVALHAVPYDDLYGSMSLFAWLLALTYLGLELFHRERAVGAFVTAVLLVWLSAVWLWIPDPVAVPAQIRGPIFAFHVTLNTWAYAAFALSFILSAIYVAQNRLLRSRRLSLAFWRFPALDVLERMSRSSVIIGLAALVVGVTFGLIWQHRLNGAVSLGDPKVVITLAIAGVYVAYLALGRNATWRGARAAMLCVANFMVVLFSYTFVNLYLTRFHRFL
jgi:HemX protein